MYTQVDIDALSICNTCCLYWCGCGTQGHYVHFQWQQTEDIQSYQNKKTLRWSLGAPDKIWNVSLIWLLYVRVHCYPEPLQHL